MPPGQPAAHEATPAIPVHGNTHPWKTAWHFYNSTPHRFSPQPDFGSWRGSVLLKPPQVPYEQQPSAQGSTEGLLPCTSCTGHAPSGRKLKLYGCTYLLPSEQQLSMWIQLFQSSYSETALVRNPLCREALSKYQRAQKDRTDHESQW